MLIPTSKKQDNDLFICRVDFLSSREVCFLKDLVNLNKEKY